MIIFNTAEVRRSNRISHTVLFRLFSQLNSRGTHSISSILPLSSGWISFMISTTRWASSWSRMRSANVPCTRGLGGRFAPLMGTNVSMCSIVSEQADPMLVSIREDQIGPGTMHATLTWHEPDFDRTCGTPLPFLPIRR